MGGRVDIILGEEQPWDPCGEVMRINRHRFISTEFSYGVVGPLASHTKVLTLIPQDSTLQDDLSRLWSLEQVPDAPTLAEDELRTVEIFNKTTTLKDGRVTVSLPFKKDPPSLGDSRRQALSRFYHNERSLKAKGKLQAFECALQEYLTLGHAHVIPPPEFHPSHDVYYLPVHGVFKDSSSTTKVRPVFDASAKSTPGHSLNDLLEIGPNLYPHLADVLFKFRQHRIGLTSDISKMFREILLDPRHQDFHRFIVRQANGQVVDCRMARVTLGVASSPYLATFLGFFLLRFNTSWLSSSRTHFRELPRPYSTNSISTISLQAPTLTCYLNHLRLSGSTGTPNTTTSSFQSQSSPPPRSSRNAMSRPFRLASLTYLDSTHP